MKQFYTMKERYPGTILFFQMGDFYETFGEDAGVVSRELDITLTSRGRDKNGERMPLAGVPIHAGEAYIARLVKKGYRVAVCDQIEDPKKAKGVVKRDVVRVITPGTVIDPGMLGTAAPSYLMAVALDSGRRSAGSAFLDISTGEFFVSECTLNNAGSELFSEIARHQPSECIVPPNLPDPILERLETACVVLTPCRQEIFDEERARVLLMDHFNVSSLEGFGCEGRGAAITAAGACLLYARETLKADLDHVNGLATHLSSGRMALDAITLRNLEILENIRNRGREQTLLWALDDTGTPMGGRMLRSYLSAPLIDPPEIEKKLDAVEYFHARTLLRDEIRTLLHRMPDIERIAGRISYGNAGPRDLITLKGALERIPAMKSAFAGEEGGPPERIADALAGVQPHEAAMDLIGRAIVDEPPAVAKSGGVIREGYNARLDEFRRIARSGKNWIAEFQHQERERTGIKSLKVGYTRVFGYYIEVTKANLQLVPPEYQRKQTTAGGERYTLPSLQETESLIANAEERLLAIETDLFTDLIEQLRREVITLQETARNIGHLDVIATLAEVARRFDYVRPQVSGDAQLIIRDGRHPVVERSIGCGFVPNDTHLDAAGDQVLIITGANMAGKSTYMRAVGLICIMAQIGSFVPASFASVGVVDRVFTRVGAFDDLASGQSTFMVEMLELANILNNVTAKSLVILDEIGRGTSTLDGFSIARAVLEYLHGKGSAGPRTLFATHFHELIEIEGDLRRVRNYHFAVRETGDDVVFLRKLIPGATDRSYGIHVAELAGTPRRVTERAKEILREMMAREYRSDGRKQPRFTQMLLIDSPELSPAHPVVEDLKKLELDLITPIEALNMLHDLQRKTREVR
jgi:DNA mismatch repair protein MutS